MNIYSKYQQTVGGIAQARHMERGREKRIEKREGERVRERGGEMEGV